eukprot:7391940-Pyramimonas_sp.AAC.1
MGELNNLGSDTTCLRIWSKRVRPDEIDARLVQKAPNLQLCAVHFFNSYDSTWAEAALENGECSQAGVDIVV